MQKIMENLGQAGYRLEVLLFILCLKIHCTSKAEAARRASLYYLKHVDPIAWKLPRTRPGQGAS